ncbi:hypothetical protein AYO20_05989 [Fonsecaea nubica]|uniref:DASH complex subunit DAD3 n=1 Tax=Fonsecaea nubica TaxID=856822 RepID=A0A178D037_9EURO|nr:hypothetical protein AYO20_05989 [Fonsecaea nubica]OAL34794.1 hypothetical protein AYO20_05989 [Fonsecaea nubica]
MSHFPFDERGKNMRGANAGVEEGRKPASRLIYGRPRVFKWGLACGPLGNISTVNSDQNDRTKIPASDPSTVGMDDSTIYNDSRHNLLSFTEHSSSEGVSPLEQDVLDEYERLSRNMKELSSTLADLSGGPITLEIAEGLRLLERKVASVYTLMKASVYSIVLQQGQVEGGDDAAGAADRSDDDGGEAAE